MSAEDELALPQVPEERPEDPEDVSWALSTAEAMWARGDHLEGIKWVRKAAEAASDAEDDERALELAKAASELTTLVARRSRASIGDGPGLAGGAPPDVHQTSVPAPEYVPQSHGMQPQSGPQSHGMQPQSGPPRSGPPLNMQPQSAPPHSLQPHSVPVSVHPPSAPPPQTSRMGNAPSAPASAPVPVTAVSAAASRPLVGKSVSPARSVAPAPIPLPSRASSAPRAAQSPQAPRATGSSPGPKARGKRRSRENMDAEAREVAGLLDTAPHVAVDGPAADRALDRTHSDGPAADAVEMPVQNARVKRRSSRPEPEATVVTNLDELTRAQLAQHRERSAQEWDASPTQNLSGEEMDHMSYGDRKTAMSVPLPPPVVVPPPVRPPLTTVHDPEIQTSQAVRVVVWRDGSGVHVAPSGTVVSSITIDAVLVVLEPGVDLTAWLSQRGT